MLTLGSMFLILFITLGPIKLVLPYVRVTANADEELRRGLALRAFGISTIVLLVVALFGAGLVQKWRISAPALMIAAAIILFLWSVQMLGQIGTGTPPPPPERPALSMAVFPLTVPAIITPYGVAAVLLFAMAPFSARLGGLMVLLLMVLAVMLLNLLFMLQSRLLLKYLGGPVTLMLLGAVLGVLQASLAVQIIINALVRLGMPGKIA